MPRVAAALFHCAFWLSNDITHPLPRAHPEACLNMLQLPCRVDVAPALSGLQRQGTVVLIAFRTRLTTTQPSLLLGKTFLEATISVIRKHAKVP